MGWRDVKMLFEMLVFIQLKQVFIQGDPAIDFSGCMDDFVNFALFIKKQSNGIIQSTRSG
jgi:hypothetical protein